jgi:hypothetical protein
MCDDVMFKRVCYIFSAVGLTDLKVSVHDFGSPNCIVHFLQDKSHLPSPRNGFFCADADVQRFRENITVYQHVVKHPPTEVSVETVEAFLSLGNRTRAILEQRSGDQEEYGKVHRLYSNCIRLSGNQPAIKTLDLIGSRDSCITFCSTDEGITGSVPEAILAAVSEAFAGLAMVAIHQNKCYQAVGYATAALFKHAGSLPFVNCVRMVCAARNDVKSVIHLTEMVILPFFLRSKDPKLRALYEVELGIWDPVISKSLAKIPPKLISTVDSMVNRFSGGFGVMKAKFLGESFVEKVCKVCSKGINGEKLFRCGGCGKVYYCSKECQLIDWKDHKKEEGCGK